MSPPSRSEAVMPTRASAVAERLRAMIRSGELAPGTHLRQAHLAADFGVSTTPVREAFVALAREGLVRQDAHRGVVVFSPSIDELNELYEIRLALEPLATELAATQIGDAELAALARILAQMQTARPDRFVELNAEFHVRIYGAARRPRLREMIEEVREPAAHYVNLNVDVYDARYRADVDAEHDAILDALRAHAPKRAAKAMREHLQHSARHVETLVARAQEPVSDA